MKFQVLKTYLQRLSDEDRPKDHVDAIPICNFTKIIDCLSLKDFTWLNHIKYPTAIKDSIATIINELTHVTSGKPKWLRASKEVFLK